MLNRHIDTMLPILATEQRDRLKAANATAIYDSYAAGGSQAIASNYDEALNAATDTLRIGTFRNKLRPDENQLPQIVADTEYVLRRFHEEGWPLTLSSEVFDRDPNFVRPCSRLKESGNGECFIADYDAEEYWEGSYEAEEEEMRVDAEHEKAQAVCSACPLRAECLAQSFSVAEYADTSKPGRRIPEEGGLIGLKTEEVGIYGGYRPIERNYIADRIFEALDKDARPDAKFPSGDVDFNNPYDANYLPEYRRYVVRSNKALDAKAWDKAKRANRKALSADKAPMQIKGKSKSAKLAKAS